MRSWGMGLDAELSAEQAKELDECHPAGSAEPKRRGKNPANN